MKNQSYITVVVPTVTYGVEALIMLKCLQSVCWVTKVDRVRHEEVRQRFSARENISD